MAIPWIYGGFHGDYFSDRLLRVYSTLLFLIISVIIAVKVQSNTSMICWSPAYFTNQHEIYTANKCNQEATLYLAERSQSVPGKDGALQEFSMASLRVFPVLLACQALLFLIPWLMWRWISTSLCNLNTTIREAISISQNATPVQEAASALSSEIRNMVQPAWPLIGKATGSHLMTFTFLLMRLFYWIICFLQLGIISVYFHFNFASFKLGQSFWEPYMNYETTEIVEDTGNETEVVTTITTTSTPFPKVVLCDFAIRQMGNIHRHTVQCNLNLADTTENCLLVVWIWIIIVLVILSISGVLQTLKTLLWLFNPGDYKSKFLAKRLSGTEGFNTGSKATAKFVQEFLKPDVMFLIGMVEENGSVLVTRAALKVLWNEFLDKGKIGSEHELTLKC